MPPSLRFETIHIIESLTEGRTGWRLFEDLEPIGIMSTPPIAVYHWPVTTREEFIERLRDIALDAVENGHSPILHIEAHGGEQGIKTAPANLSVGRFQRAVGRHQRSGPHEPTGCSCCV
jgi:hypothetical protein